MIRIAEKVADMPPKMPLGGNENLEDQFDFNTPTLEQQLVDSKRLAKEAEQRATLAEARVEDLEKVKSLENSLIDVLLLFRRVKTSKGA